LMEEIVQFRNYYSHRKQKLECNFGFLL